MACILIADDDPFNRELMRDLLEAAGHQVSEASDGVEALRYYRPGGVDLVICGVYMRGKSGLELLGELRNIHPDAPVIVCGHRNPSEQARARNLGAVRTFEKPVRPAEILRAVEDVVSRPGMQVPPAAGGAPDA